MQIIKTKSLVDYMKKRSTLEGRNWNIPDSYLEEMFVQKGTRIFFGVVLDDLGNMLEDKKNKDFFWCWQRMEAERTFDAR